jgi:hypothetical protein
VIQKDPVDAVPLKVVQQMAKLALHVFQIDVMTETRFEPGAMLAGLVWVDFPWMEIKHAGRLFFCIDLAD